MMILAQQRAKDALDQVKKLDKESKEFRKLYRSYVDRIGPAIVMNGLGQALATERAAAGSRPANDREKAHARLYGNLQAWLCNKSCGIYKAKNLGSDTLLKAIMENDESMYLHAQAEALAWLEWHKKFCRAHLPKDGGNEE